MALGVGVASAVGLGVAFVVRQNALADLRDACPAYQSGSCPASTRSILARGDAASTAVTVFSVVTAIGLGTGVTLWWLDPSSTPSSTPKTGMTLSPWAGANGGGAVLQGAF